MQSQNKDEGASIGEHSSQEVQVREAPISFWRGHITAAPDPQNENACQCSFELGDRLHLQRVTRFMTVKAIKDDSAVRRLATSTGQESTCGSEEENDIWEEVTKMLRMNRGEEGLQTHHEP